MNKDFNNPDFLYKFLNNNNLYIDPILSINGVKIPNFYLNYCNKILPQDMMIFELNHLIYKIFLSNQNQNLTCYETPLFQISSNDIVFDCGANMGLFSAAAASRCKEVYSFEPMSLIRKNLKETAYLYNNIHIIPCGLWKTNNIMTLIQKNNPGASSVLQYDNISNQTLYREQCSMITIDNFIAQTNIIPTFIKMDIEGSEIQLLEGASNCIYQYSPKISIALHHYHFNTIDYIKQLLVNYSINIQFTPQGIFLMGEKNEKSKFTK